MRQTVLCLGLWALFALLPQPSEQFRVSGLGQAPGLRAQTRSRSSALSISMKDDMLKRVGRLAKDKIGKGKEWVDDGSNLDKGINLRGAGAGAIAGGLLLGPLGALAGGWLGKGAGLSKAAEQEELARLGFTAETAKMAKDLIFDLRDTQEALELAESVTKNSKSKVERLNSEAEMYYDRAKEALEADNEDKAREFLTRRQQCLEDLPKAEIELADNEGREENLRGILVRLGDRLDEIESLASRMKAGQATKAALEGGALDGTIKDPLLEKFDKWEKEK